MNVIEKAIGFAVKAHAGALRKGTTLPYILHPMEAASIAAQLTDDQEIIAATVLTILPEALRQFADYRMLVYAVVLIVVMIATYNPAIRSRVSAFADKYLRRNKTGAAPLEGGGD